MATIHSRPSVLLKYGDHEYLAYEVTDHAERPPTSIVVRLERHGDPKHAVFCTGSFSRGKLRKVYTVSPDNAGSGEEREVIRLFNASPEARAFVKDWILYCYHSYEASSEATPATRRGGTGRKS